MRHASRVSPLCLFGWQTRDLRTKSALSIGNALMDGNYRTSWDHYDVPTRQAMVSSLAYLKGTDSLPPGLLVPLTNDGRFLRSYVHDCIQASKDGLSGLSSQVTIFHRSYDVICPLPSSKGPASKSNSEVAHVIAKVLQTPICHFIVRRSPMTIKSTLTNRTLRTDPDAPRLMHYDSMQIDKTYLKNVKGSSVLLYDDILTWGNTSEAARNLLLLAGAEKVDVITCFSTGPVFRSAEYQLNSEKDLTECQSVDFELVNSTLVEKGLLKWTTQKSLKEWHELVSQYTRAKFPEMVPNDIPF